ncbi:MAG: hypothetical protein ACRDPO_20260 [Streptosporangiaceae bacterium]
MTTWDELKPILTRLASSDPVPLTSWPDPAQDDGRQPPFAIELEPWAIDVAQDLHGKFGDDVQLMVGALRYPERTLPIPPTAGPPVPVLDPAELSVTLDGPLSIRSGTMAHHGLVVRNLGRRDVVIGTTGELIAEVVDPATGEVVGGYAGAVRLMLQTFTVAPATAKRIPMLVATASRVPDLGYAIPPGQWGLQVTLDPAAGAAVRTPPLPMTVTG